MTRLLRSAGLAGALLLALAWTLRAQVDTANHWTVGSRVHANNAVCARADTAQTTCGALRVAGTKGTILRGPAGASTLYGLSWFLHYDVAPDGWSTQKYLTLDSLAGTSPPGPVPVARVLLNVAGTVWLTAVGGTYQASATPMDSAGHALARPVTWRATAPAIASVDSTGLVTARGDGRDSVWASADGKSAFFLVLVGTPPAAPVGWSLRRSSLVIPPQYWRPPCLVNEALGAVSTCGPYAVSDDSTGVLKYHVTLTVTISP